MCSRNYFLLVGSFCQRYLAPSNSVMTAFTSSAGIKPIPRLCLTTGSIMSVVASSTCGENCRPCSSKYSFKKFLVMDSEVRLIHGYSDSFLK